MSRRQQQQNTVTGPPAALSAYTNSLTLNDAQKTRLIEVYLSANKQERQEIAAMYSAAFRDPDFVQNLAKQAHLRLAAQAEKDVAEGRAAAAAEQKQQQQQQQQKKKKSSIKVNGRKNSGSGAESKTKLSGSRRARNETAADEGQGENAAGPRRTDDNDDDANDDDGGGKELTISDQEKFLRDQRLATANRCRMIRKKIDMSVSRVVGPGPHRLRFGVARTKADCQKIIDIYKDQFLYPGEAELRKNLVLPPQKKSVKNRSAPRIGNFHWFIVLEETGEVATAASVNLHPVMTGSDERIVFEIPLFATAAGFKNLGLARLLNAAIQELAVNMKAECVLVSADEDAVPFWTSAKLGQAYEAVSKKPEVYETMCHQFGDSVCLGWIPASGSDALNSAILDAALSKTPRFVINGPARLSMP